MKGFLIVVAALLFTVIVAVLFYAAFGAVFYFGVPVLGVEMTFAQGIVLAILISAVGTLFNGGKVGKQSKGDD